MQTNQVTEYSVQTFNAYTYLLHPSAGVPASASGSASAQLQLLHMHPASPASTSFPPPTVSKSSSSIGHYQNGMIHPRMPGLTRCRYQCQCKCQCQCPVPTVYPSGFNKGWLARNRCMKPFLTAPKPDSPALSCHGRTQPFRVEMESECGMGQSSRSSAGDGHRGIAS